MKEDQVGAVGGPKVVGAVEAEENEKGEEDARHPGHICCNQQVSRRPGEVEVAVVGAQEDAAGDVEDVVDGQLLGDSVVQRRGAWGCGVEAVEWVAEQL